MPAPLPGSQEDLLHLLEQLSGRPIRSGAELEAYLNELRSHSNPPGRAQRVWAVARHATLGVGLLIAVLQYYLIDIYVQIASMQRVQFLTPDPAPLQKSALELLNFLC